MLKEVLIIIATLVLISSCSQQGLEDTTGKIGLDNKEIRSLERNKEYPEFEKGVINVKFKQGYDVISKESAISLTREIKKSNFADMTSVEKVFRAKPTTKNYNTKSQMGLQNWVRIKFSENIDVWTEAKKWSELNEVEIAEPIPKRIPLEYPNDPQFTYQWHHENTGDNIPSLPSTPGVDLDTPEAWDLEKGNVIITNYERVDWRHEDLIDNIWQNLDEDYDGDGHVLEYIEGEWRFDPGDENGVDDDNNGYIDDFIGWDISRDINDPSSDYTHGTKTVGAMLATPNNNKGVAGVCWNCKLMVISGTGMYFQEQIEYSVDNGVKIITMSFMSSLSEAERDAFEYAYQQGIVMFAGAGNNGEEDANNLCEFEPLNCVSGSDIFGKIIDFSNYGNEMDISAPADHVRTTSNENNYLWAWGTSFSSPIAAGVAGLVMSQNPSLSPYEVKSLMQTSVDKIIEPTKYAGMGVINAERAVDLAKNSEQYGHFPIAIIEESDTIIENQQLNIYGVADSTDFIYYKIGYGPGLYEEPQISTPEILVPVEEGLLYSLDLSNLEKDEYHIYLKVKDINDQIAIDDFFLKRDTSQTCKGWIPTETCSINQPNYCTGNLEITNNCQECGCPTGLSCNLNGSCSEQSISSSLSGGKETKLNLIFDKTVIDRILESIKPIEKTETTKEIVPGLITITGKHSQRINLFELISNLFSK